MVRLPKKLLATVVQSSYALLCRGKGMKTVVTGSGGLERTRSALPHLLGISFLPFYKIPLDGF